MLKELKIVMKSNNPIQALKTLWTFNRGMRDMTAQTQEMINKIEMLEIKKYDEGFRDGYEEGKKLHEENCHALSQPKNDK